VLASKKPETTAEFLIPEHLPASDLALNHVSDSNHIYLLPSEQDERNLWIQSISNSIVVWGFQGTTGLRAIHAHGITNSIVFIVAPLDGSVFLDQVKDSVLVLLCCRQFRLHHAERTTVITHSVSGPIIEDSHDLKFLPMDYSKGFQSANPTLQVV
jgi:hypothetical protein